MFVLILFCAQLLFCVIFGIPIEYPMLAGLVIFTLYGKNCGYSWKSLAKMIAEGIKTSKTILFIFIFIGLLTAFWRASGTVPYIVCFAGDFIRPNTMIILTFLLNCMVSVLTGTAFGTSATMGTICMSVAVSMGLSPLPIGGAIICGVYFGDRCSPVSTSALLVSELTKTNLYTNLRLMIKTAFVPFVLSCIFFAVCGLFFTAERPETVSLWEIFGQEFRLHWIALIPAIIILVLPLFKVNVKWTLGTSIGAAVVICLFLQGYAPSEVLDFAVFGFKAGAEDVNALLNGGGILSMVRVGIIVCASSAYSGIFQETGLLESIKDRIEAFGEKTNAYTAMVLTSVITAMIACNQTLTIILTHQLCSETEKDRQTEAIDLENSAVVIAPLVPWSIAVCVPLSIIGGSRLCILFAFFLYILPLWTIIRKHK